MADEKKKPTKKPSADRKTKELDAEQLEKVSGGLLPAVNVGSYKPQFKWAPEQKIIGEEGIKIIGEEGIKIIGEDSIAPALKK